jgi:hypothetical protein
MIIALAKKKSLTGCWLEREKMAGGVFWTKALRNAGDKAWSGGRATTNLKIG